jgi:hypothetical protein
MVGMRAMAEVQPKDIGSGLEQGTNGRDVRAGGSEGGDDLGIPFTLHGRVLWCDEKWPYGRLEFDAYEREVRGWTPQPMRAKLKPSLT